MHRLYIYNNTFELYFNGLAETQRCSFTNRPRVKEQEKHPPSSGVMDVLASTVAVVHDRRGPRQFPEKSQKVDDGNQKGADVG